RARAAIVPRAVIFPESADQRIRAAVASLNAERIVRPVVVLDPAAPESHDDVRALGVEVLDPRADRRRDRVIADLLAARGRKGMTPDEAAALANHPLYFADDLVHHEEVDACVAGCVYTTADVLRGALWLVGPRRGVATVSSAFYMAVPNF